MCVCKGGALVLISLTQTSVLALLTHALSAPQTTDPPEPLELVQPHEPLEEHLLCVKKTSVGRTHSLPNDSYMFLPLERSTTSATLKTTARQAQSGTTHRTLLNQW